MSNPDEERLLKILEKQERPERLFMNDEFEEGDTGVNRSSTEGKTDYLLVRDGPMFQRWAAWLSRFAPTRGKRNWMNAHEFSDLERFVESAARHFEQWLNGEDDGEDHAAAIIFNINGAEYVKEKLMGEMDANA